MSHSQLMAAAAELFREAFEGVAPGKNSTFFVQGKESIFDAIDHVTAEQASWRPNEGVSSIAAHADHTRYYIHLANQENCGTAVEADWASSWRNQSVDSYQWDAIRSGLRAEYETMLAWLRSVEGKNDFDFAISVMGQVAHAAYHLGALRQLVNVQKALIGTASP